MYTEQQVREATLEYFQGDELATNVFMTKYCLKNKQGEYVEKSPLDMHKRMAKEFARIEAKHGGPRALSEEKIMSYFDNFKYIVPQGSPMMGIGNDYVNVSLSNCVVVQSPDDNISSIVNAGRDLGNLFKRRCGVGLDISELRPDGTLVNNSAGTTTGAWSFADFYSYVCRMIGQNGRRGALMITMDVRHPDIEKFVTMKHDLTKVTGANVSVKITDDFMKAVVAGETFNLHHPVGADEPTYTKEVNAAELWKTIVESATTTAEPGLLMWDNIVNNLPANEYAEEGFKTICTNPCAEIPLSAYDSCRLISINLKNFVQNPFEAGASFDYSKFTEVVSSAMRLSDDLVDLELEKLSKILEVSDTADEKELWSKLHGAAANGRRTGLGTHGLADALACLGVAYDSDEAIKTVSDIYSCLRDVAYRESMNLSTERGSFPVFSWDKEKENAFIQRLPESLRQDMSIHGRRNISILTNAPTGSVSILSQTSSGLEPVFRNSYVRRRKLSHDEVGVEADFIDDLGDRWKNFEVFHHNVQQWRDKQGAGSTELPAFFVESDQIDWQRRVEIQQAIQDNIDHAISSTINLPAGTEPSVVGDLYLEGWKRGLKGITVYVDGSRSGVLVTKEDATGSTEEFPQYSAPKRPSSLECEIHHTTVKGEKWVVLVGLMDGKPYEVLAGEASLIEIPKKFTNGTLTKTSFKTKENRYDLTFGDDGVIKDVVKVFDNPTHSAFTRMISLGLRHGAEVKFMVEQLQKDKHSDMFSFSRCVSRILKNYIQDGSEATDKTCPECGSEGMVYQDGCKTCKDCGYAACG